MKDCDIAIVGGGVAGLAAAIELQESGRNVLVLEASDAVGGRVRTDTVSTSRGDYLLDRGFQVYLTAYPDAREKIDHASLDFCAFEPGAKIRVGQKFHTVSDPFRRPGQALKMFGSPVATLDDQVRLGLLDRSLKKGKPEDAWQRPETTTVERLRAAGFHESTIDRFFRAFFGGVFFDRTLETSSRMFEFTYRMFATGDAVVPARGMESISRQLASKLPPGTIRTGTRVSAVDHTAQGAQVTLASNETLHAEGVIVASAFGVKIAGEPLPEPAWQSTVCVWFDAPGGFLDPVTGGKPILVLDAEATDAAGPSPVNHAAVMSDASSHYAPDGRALIAANVVLGTQRDIGLADAASDESLAERCRAQVASWVGREPGELETLKIQRIDRALPTQVLSEGGSLEPATRLGRPFPTVLVCGDAFENASINGAMRSGSLAARTLLDEW